MAGESSMLRRGTIGLVLAACVALTGCYGDGIWQVGSGGGEIPPGLYSAPAGPQCHWARYQGGNPGFVTAENWAVSRMFVEITADDDRFLSERCGPWTAPQAGAYTAHPGALVESDQNHRVGIDMMAGTWRSSGSGDCLWIRLRDWKWDYDGTGVIASGTAPGPVSVTIAPTDVGFESVGCGGWYKVA